MASMISTSKYTATVYPVGMELNRELINDINKFELVLLNLGQLSQHIIIFVCVYECDLDLRNGLNAYVQCWNI